MSYRYVKNQPNGTYIEEIFDRDTKIKFNTCRNFSVTSYINVRMTLKQLFILIIFLADGPFRDFKYIDMHTLYITLYYIFTFLYSIL